MQAAVDEAVAGVEGKVRIGADTADLDAKVAAARAKVDELSGTEAKARIGADDADASAKLDDIRERLESIGATRAEPTIDASDDRALTALEDIRAQLEELDKSTNDVRLTLEDADIGERLDAIRGDLDELDTKEANPKLGLDDEEFKAKLAEDEAALQSAGSSSGGGGFGIPGGMWTGVAGGIASILPGLAGATTGLGALGGTALAAFEPIAKTLSAAHQASQNVGQTSAQMAQTQFTNSVAVQQAQQGIAQAQAQAAQTAITSSAAVQQAQRAEAENAITSAQQIESAQSNLAQTERNAAASQIQAIQAVRQAQQQEVQSQQQLQQANYALSSAQYNLSEAWISAKYSLQQLRDAEANSATTIAAAKLAVEQAQRQQILTDQNAFSTSLDRQQAAIAVTQAEEQLTAAQQAASETQAQYNLQNKAGVSGSQQVKAAQEAVTQALNGVKDATYGVGNARQAYANAERNLKDTELNNAAQIKQAQLAVTQAQQQAAYQAQSDAAAVAQAQEQAAFSQRQSAQSVQQAQQNLTNTIKEQRLAMAATASTANQAANQFAKDFAALSPAGQKVVDMLLSMRGAWKNIEGIAQTAIMPGVLQFLRGIKDLLPQIDFGARLFGKSISDAFGQFGKQMQTAGFANVFHSLLVQGNQFINTVLPAFGRFISELARVGAQKGAVSGLANILAGIGNGLTAVVRALSPFVSSLSSVLSTLGSALRPIGTLLGDIVGGLAKALAPGLAALLPGFTKFVDLLGSSLARALASLAPDMGVIGQGLSSMLTALSPLLPPLATLIGALGKALTPILVETANAAGPLITALVQGLTPVIKALSPLLVQIGNQLASQQGLFMATLQAILPVIPALGRLVAVGVQVMTWLMQLDNAITGPINSAFAAMMRGIGDIVSAVTGWMSSTKNWENAWHTFATDMWNWLWNDFGQKILTFFTSTVPGWWDQFVGLTSSHLVQPAEGVLHDLWQWIGADFGAKIENFFTSTVPGWWDNAVTLTRTHLVQPAENVLHDLWTWIWSDFGAKIQGFFVHTIPGWWDTFWSTTKRVFNDGVSALHTIWSKLEGYFKSPVNFLIKTVYDGGIARLWNDVAAKIPGVPKMPTVAGLAGGGITPGTDRGHDAYLLPMRPGEGVLTPPTVQGLGGPSAVYALNNAFDPKSNKAPGQMTGLSGGGSVSDALSKSASGVKEGSGGSNSGILGDIGHWISARFHEAYSGGRLAMALATGNTTAAVNALKGFVSTPATGALGKMMTGIPMKLIRDVVEFAEQTTSIASQILGGGLPGGSSGAVGNLPANWKAIATFLSNHGFTKFASAGVAGNIFAESGGDPEILQAGGGGGGGLIQWTPYPPGYITGDYQRDLYTQLNAILSWGGGPGTVNRATSPSNAAQIYQDIYERPASLTASLPARMASANAVYQAMGWGKLDSGGYLPPPINATGRPERVLDPQQTQAFDRLVTYLTSHGGDGASAGPNVNLNYFGPQQPTPEMQANMMRDLALTLSR